MEFPSTVTVDFPNNILGLKAGYFLNFSLCRFFLQLSIFCNAPDLNAHSTDRSAANKNVSRLPVPRVGTTFYRVVKKYLQILHFYLNDAK